MPVLLANTQMQNVPVICLMGTTATGKTDAAAHLVDALDAEIISVDSSLVYRGMDIGTAKPDPEFLERYPHHLIDIRHPNDTYSVADFHRDCAQLIKQICRRGRVPILVGGTHFYFNALEQGLAELPEADAQLRSEISYEAEQSGWPQQHARLALLDPQSADRIDPMDAQRIQRALEIVISGGHPVSYYNNSRQKAFANPLLKIALSFSDRKNLHRRIEQRFDIMLERGLKREVEQLLVEGVDAQTAAMRMIGYRQMLSYLDGSLSWDEMRDKGIVATRQLAKRQLTWLRNQANVVWWVDHGLEKRDFGHLSAFVDGYF